MWGNLTLSTNSFRMRDVAFPGSDISAVTNSQGEALLTGGLASAWKGVSVLPMPIYF